MKTQCESFKQEAMEVDAATKMLSFRTMTPEEWIEDIVSRCCPVLFGYDMLELVHEYERSIATNMALLTKQKDAARHLAFQALDWLEDETHAGVIGIKRQASQPISPMPTDVHNPARSVVQTMMQVVALQADIARSATNVAIERTERMAEIALDQQGYVIQTLIEQAEGWLDTLADAKAAGAAALH